MRSSRQIRRNGKVERPFIRRIGYETLKEGTGSAVQQGATALGALMGLLSSRWGMPATASVITGAIIGNALGSFGKGVIAASVDRMRERREARTPNQVNDSTSDQEANNARVTDSGNSLRAGGLHARRGASGTTPTGRSRVLSGSGSGGGIAGQVISGIEQVMEQIEQTAAKLNAVAASMRNSQDSMMVLIYGGRADVVRRTHDAMSGARDKVYDSAVLLRSASEDLRAYRASI